MKKISMLALLLSVSVLASCGEKPTENPLESLAPGEIPTGGEEVSIEDLESILNAESPEEPVLKNGYAVSVKLPSLLYSTETTYASNFDYKTGEYLNEPVTETDKVSLNITDGALDVKVTGLTSANNFSEFGLSANASAKVSFDMGDEDSKIDNELFTINSYFKDRNLYLDLSRNLLDLMGVSSEETNKVYGILPEGIEDEFIEETGLTFPVLSQANIEYISQLLEEQMNVTRPELDTTAVVDLVDDFAKIVYENLFTVTKYGSDYLLTLNLTNENLNSNIVKLLDAAYADGLFTYIAGAEVSKEEYDYLKAEMLNVISTYTTGFNHLKYSVVFDSTMVKSMALDVDLSITTSSQSIGEPFEEGVGSIVETFSSTVTLKGALNVSFEYSDDITISYPSLTEYEKVENMFGGVEENPLPVPGI